MDLSDEGSGEGLDILGLHSLLQRVRATGAQVNAYRKEAASFLATPCLRGMAVANSTPLTIFEKSYPVWPWVHCALEGPANC